jgi:hypothetical protein
LTPYWLEWVLPLRIRPKGTIPPFQNCCFTCLPHPFEITPPPNHHGAKASSWLGYFFLSIHEKRYPAFTGCSYPPWRDKSSKCNPGLDMFSFRQHYTSYHSGLLPGFHCIPLTLLISTTPTGKHLDDAHAGKKVQ